MVQANLFKQNSILLVLLVENYDFDKAVDFFKDSNKLRINELLQQFENGKVRDDYRKMIENGEITTEQLEDVLKEKRNEVVQDVVEGRYDVDNTESKGDVKNGVDKGRKISKNGKRSDQMQANSKARSVSEGRVGVYNQQSGSASLNQRRSGTTEKRNLSEICDNENFSKISRIVGNTLTYKLNKKIYAEYVNDSRSDIYDFSEVITYDD